MPDTETQTDSPETWSRRQGVGLSVCLQCGKNPPAKARRICKECWAAKEKAGRIRRAEAMKDKPCAMDGCDEPRYAMTSQVASYCQEHRRQVSKKNDTAKRRRDGAPERIIKPAPDVIPEGQTWCPRCETLKSTEEGFYRVNVGKPKKRRWCKDCTNERFNERKAENPELFRARSRASMKKHYRRRLYGITPEAEALILESQDSKCGICREPLGEAFHVDHDHTAEKESGLMVVRGFLCSGCNSGMGLLKDSEERLVRAALYLIHGCHATESQDVVDRVIEMIKLAPITLSA